MSNFGDLINIDEFEKKHTFNEDRGPISFYCKECKAIVTTQREQPKGYIFICEKCQSKNIVIGTKESLKTKFRLTN